MNKKKIGYIILVVIFSLIVINTVVSYVSYTMVCNGKEPNISIKTKKTNNKVVYKQLLYKIIKEEKESERTVSLKLFFLD